MQDAYRLHQLKSYLEAYTERGSEDEWIVGGPAAMNGISPEILYLLDSALGLCMPQGNIGHVHGNPWGSVHDASAAAGLDVTWLTQCPKPCHRDDDHLRRIFRDAVKRSGVRRPITPHDIRRAAATHLHLAGMPLKRLQDILGHNSLEVTQLYILEDESEINGSHRPFDLLSGID